VFNVTPDSDDIVVAEATFYNPDSTLLGVLAYIDIKDYQNHVVASEDYSTKNQSPVEKVTARSQQEKCSVPTSVVVRGSVGCSAYDMKVTLQSRIYHNFAGTSFATATSIPRGQVSDFCGSLNDIKDCNTGPVWTFDGKKDDKVLVNSLMVGSDRVGFNVKWTLYNKNTARVTSKFSGGSGRTQISAEFTLPEEGKFYLQLNQYTWSVYSYAVAIEIRPPCQEVKENKFTFKTKTCKYLKKMMKKQPDKAMAYCNDPDSGAMEACPKTCDTVCQQ